MKQLLLRVDDHLHAELMSQAKASGRSLNSLANEVLSLAVRSQSDSRRDRLNQRIAALGITDMNWGDLPVAAYSREDAIAESKAIGPVDEGILDAERDIR